MSRKVGIERKDLVKDIGHVEYKRFCDKLDLTVKADKSNFRLGILSE